MQNQTASKLDHPAVKAFKLGYGSEFDQDFSDSRSEVTEGHLDLVVQQQLRVEKPEYILTLLETTQDNFVKQTETYGYFEYNDFDVAVEVANESMKVSSHLIVGPTQVKKGEKIGIEAKNAMSEVANLILMLSRK
jgi:hypothetical protein